MKNIIEAARYRGENLFDGKTICGYPAFEFFEKHGIAFLSPAEREYAPVKVRTLRRFTTLLDKEGNEIYEGDYIRDGSGQRWTVTFKNGCFIAQREREFEYLYHIAPECRVCL